MAMKRKKKRRRPNEEASYVCDACGEEIVIPVDMSAGESQEYIEDCPVCCRPNVVHVEIDEGGGVRVWAEAEG
jgi:transcription elongation factor Elf1